MTQHEADQRPKTRHQFSRCRFNPFHLTLSMPRFLQQKQIELLRSRTSQKFTSCRPKPTDARPTPRLPYLHLGEWHAYVAPLVARDDEVAVGQST